MYSFLSTFCFILFLSCGQCKKEKLRLQLLVPQKSENNRIYHQDNAIPAAQLAVKDINKDPNYLPGYNLTIEFADTRCDPSEGTWQMIKSVLDTSDSDETKIIAFIGGSCSIVSEPTAALSGQLYQVVQVSYSSGSPILSETEMYPYFYRTYPSQNLYNNVYFSLMSTYNWCIVATLHQTVNLFSLAVTDFHTRFDSLRNTTAFECDKDDKPILFSFTGDPEIPLRQIMTKDVRIIFGYFYEDKAVVVMCFASHMGLTDSTKYLWIFPGWYTANWWNLADTMDWSEYRYNCTSKQIKEAISHSIITDYYPFPLDRDQKSLSGYTTDEYIEAFNESYNEFLSEPGWLKTENFSDTVNFHTLTYDAVWSVAIALNKTDNVIQSSLSDFTYSDKAPNQASTVNEITGNLSAFLNETNFRGVSGNVTFNKDGDRTGYSMINQYIYENGEVKTNLLALYNREVTQLRIMFDRDPEWGTETGDPPTDRSTPKNVTITTALVIAMDVLIGIGILIAVALLVFNTVTIRKPLIRDSAPLINTVIIIGCIILMTACVLLGVDSNNPLFDSDGGSLDLTNVTEDAETRYASVCTTRLWLLTIGFTLSFGALFAKTLQVYRVYTNPKLKEQPFKIWNFLIIMAILLLADIIILSIWTGLYNFTRGTEERLKGNTLYIYEYCMCDNFSYLIGSLYVYKGLMTIFGLFLAYESRNVKYMYLNDSRFVSIAMYIVVILVGISSLLSLVLAEERFVDASYGVAVFIIVLACTSCLLILYIPKFYYMAKGADTMIPQAKLEKFTPVDRLQLGKSEVNPEDIQNAEKEIKELKEQVEQVAKNEYQLQEVGVVRRGSDQDSGVHCTTTEETDVSINSPTVMGMNVTTCTDITTCADITIDGGENGGSSSSGSSRDTAAAGDDIIKEEDDDDDDVEITENDVKQEISKC